MTPSATVFTLFDAQISWVQLVFGGAVAAALYILFFSLVLEKEPRIHIIQAFRNAFRIGRQQFGGLVRFLTVELCITLICLSPLLFLAEKNVRFLAGLTVPLWILIMFPVRANAAAAMQDALNGRRLFTGRLAEISGWPGKVLGGLKRTLYLLIWGAPLAGALIYAYRISQAGTGEENGLTALQSVQDFGGGDVMTGVRYLALILLSLVLILLVGFAFHSGARHAKALGNPEALRSHHGKIVAGWFCSLVILWPMIIALAVITGAFMPQLNDPNSLLMDDGLKLPPMRILAMITGAGGLMTLPLLPFRSLVTAAMVNQAGQKQASSEKAGSLPQADLQDGYTDE